MKKKIASLSLLIILLILFMPNFAEAHSPIKIIVNDKEIKLDVEAFIKNGRTMVPIRFIAEELGLEVTFNRERWIEKDSIINVINLKDKNNRTTKIDIVHITSSDGITYNYDENYEFGYIEPRIIKQDRAFVPLRPIANALNLNTNWSSATKTITLTTDYSNKKIPLYFNKTMSPKEDIKAPFDIRFKNNRYELSTEKTTLQDMLIAYNSKIRNMDIYEIFEYDKKHPIESLYNNNYFFMNLEKKDYREENFLTHKKYLSFRSSLNRRRLTWTTL